LAPFIWDLLLIAIWIFVSGIFAAAEIAVLVACRSRLKEEMLADRGKKWSARLVLSLGQDPAALRCVTRLAVTLIGTLVAVLAGSRLLASLTSALEAGSIRWVAGHSASFALLIVTLGLALFWLVFGELVPKRLALANPERAARLLAYPLHWLRLFVWPIAWLLGKLAAGIAFLLIRRSVNEPAISADEIEQILAAGRGNGSSTPAEPSVAVKAQRLADRTVREIMRPRIEIDALDVDTPPNEVVGAAAMAGFSRLPVHEGDLDHIIGFIYMKDLLRQQFMGWPIEVRKLVRPALLVPASLHIDKLLGLFRAKRTQMAIVLDQFGGTLGLVTMEDVLEEIVGEIHDETRLEHTQDIVRRNESTWLVSGSVNLDDLLDQLGLQELRTTEPRDYTTVGGLVMSLLDRIPQNGDSVEWNGLHLEVVRMDGPRVDRILLQCGDLPR
jgi:putative hemolysin